MFTQIRKAREEAHQLEKELCYPMLYEGPPLGLERLSVPSIGLLPDRRLFVRSVNACIQQTSRALEDNAAHLSGEKAAQISRLNEKLVTLRGLAAGQLTMPFYR